MLCARSQEMVGLDARYNLEKNRLQANLDNLFNRYAAELSGQQAKAMIETRRTGLAMLSNVDFLCFPSMIVATLSEDNQKNNYDAVLTIYQHANNIIELLLVENKTQEQITEINKAKNLLVNSVAAAGEGNSIPNRVLHGMRAFLMALGTLVSMAVAALAIVMPFAAVTIPLAALGLFGTGVFGTKMVYSVKNANDSAQKSVAAFSENIDTFVSHVAPAPSLK